MRILFLDMDGVLNSVQSSHYFWRTKYNRKTFMNGFESLCPIACSNLDYLLESYPDMKVVISSTWRRFHDLKEWDEKMKDICPSIVGRVIGKTPGNDCGERGNEIYNWLEQNNHFETPFVVLDDDSDMNKVSANFVHIDSYHGLQWFNVVQAKIIIGNKPITSAVAGGGENG